MNPRLAALIVALALSWFLLGYAGGLGEKSVVYYSASHPWLSSLRRPETVGQGWPVVLLVLLVAIKAAITIMKPQSRWALNFDVRGSIK